MSLTKVTASMTIGTMTAYPMEKIKVTFAYGDTFDAGTVHAIYEG